MTDSTQSHRWSIPISKGITKHDYYTQITTTPSNMYIHNICRKVPSLFLNTNINTNPKTKASIPEIQVRGSENVIFGSPHFLIFKFCRRQTSVWSTTSP